MNTNNVAKTLFILGVITIVFGLLFSIFFESIFPLILFSSVIFGAILIGLAKIIMLLQEISRKLGPEVVYPIQSNLTLPLKNSQLHSVFIGHANEIKKLFTHRNETLKSIFPTPFTDFYFVETNNSIHLVELGGFVPNLIPKER